MWPDENANTFKDMLLHDSIIQEILNLNYRLDNMNDTDVNSCVNDLNDIYIRVANSSLKFERNNNSSYKHKKANPKNVWMSNECLRLRREVRSLSKRGLKGPNNNSLIHVVCACKKVFNKVRKKLRQNSFNSLIYSVNETHTKYSRQFWNNLKKAKSKDTENESPILESEFKNHYEQLK